VGDIGGIGGIGVYSIIRDCTLRPKLHLGRNWQKKAVLCEKELIQNRQDISMQSRYKIFQNEYMYFISSTIVEWIPVFTSPAYFQILVTSLKYCQKNKNLSIFSYVILDNHFHLICQAPELSRTIQSLKRYSARSIIKQLEKDHKKWMLNLFSYYKKFHKTTSVYQVWQERIHPQQIINERMLLDKVEYIHYSPVKRGLVGKPEYWFFSSAVFYNDGHEGVLKVDRFDI
jgi:REP element-mobilizing transposase RayT